MRKLKIVITGASGFVGKQIVPIFLAEGMGLVLVGRDKAKLTRCFGHDVTVANYEELDFALKNADGLVHLAAKNNTQDAPIDEFRTVNVELLAQVLAAVERAQVAHVIYTTSLHTLENNTSPYAITKREAEALLEESSASYTLSTLVLPAVYGDDIYAGKLANLRRFPKILRRPLFCLLSAMRPTVHASLVAQAVIGAFKNNENTKRIVSDRQMTNPLYAGVMRVVDLLFAGAVIGLFWWLLMAVWVIVKTTSPGPGLFAQVRVGRGGKTFVCYKFRTMYVGTQNLGTHDIPSSNVTKFGKIIRRLKIDELPQVWNIIRNQMSLIGPRPCLPVQHELVEARQKRGVLDTKSGVSGYAQVLGFDMSNPNLLAEMDEKYLAIRTIPLDMKIIVQTILAVRLVR